MAILIKSRIVDIVNPYPGWHLRKGARTPEQSELGGFAMASTWDRFNFPGVERSPVTGLTSESLKG